MTNVSFQRSKRRQDLLAKWIITFFGLTTILSVLAIVVVVFLEFLPLFSESRLIHRSKVITSTDTILASQGPWLEKAWSLSAKGHVSIHDLKSGTTNHSFKLRPDSEAHIIHSSIGLDNVTTLTWSDKLMTRHGLSFKPRFDEKGIRSLHLNDSSKVSHYLSSHPLLFGLSRNDGEGVSLFLGINQEKQVIGHRKSVTEDFLGNVTQKSVDLNFPTKNVTHLGASPSGQTIFTLTQEGRLTFWDLRYELAPKGSLSLDLKNRKVTDMCSLIGTDEVAISYSSGDVEIASLASKDGGPLEPALIHHQKVSAHPIASIHPSPRNRTLFIKNQNQEVIAWYTTNNRSLFRKKVNMSKANFSVAPRGKGITLWSDEGELSVNEWVSPHPEGGWKAFFQKIWYSGYPEPDYVWQSSSGSDDFEPKISLIPLVTGSIKGAFYAMLFSVPLAVLAALYTSVFAGPKIKGIIKPTIEMMSAIPSVVVGLLAALWLAPLIDGHLLTLFIFFPVSVLALLFLPSVMEKALGRDSIYKSTHLVLLMTSVVLCFSLYLSSLFAQGLEGIGAFEGDFRSWFLQDLLNGKYDMRNSMLISIALGFAVIPIVYSISEDSLSSVPKELSSASLALGATPWQTAWHVVLPAASPGIFAAMTLGLGRAIGETMIVLMATGNTPILDFNIFEGFRALSANIAIEMPEAPSGGTLYRTLFLSAAVLLIFTSILNMITETIRHRLSKKYASL